MIIGVDTGGTFTDFVVVDKDEIRIHKVPSTPEDPSQAVLQGLTELLGDSVQSDSEIIHGSTVATNSLLERKGATVALLTTAGFEDVIEIGRQTRREIYDLAVTKPEPLVPSKLLPFCNPDVTVQKPVSAPVHAEIFIFSLTIFLYR